MPRFAYKAVDNKGEESSGIIEAENEADALDEIRRMGLFVADVRAAHMGDEIRAKWREQKVQRRAEETKRQEEARSRHPRQRLVVRYANGKTDYGVCFALNPKENSFHLDRVGPDGKTTGETVQVRFVELKAVFQVKSFDGKFDRSQPAPASGEVGKELIVEFSDGEVLRGYGHRVYDPDAPRFFLIPREQNTNNINILVERKALAAVHTPEEYKEKLEQEREERKQKPESTGLTQEETMGDFYFELRNYTAAFEQYDIAFRKQPHSGRLRRKFLAAQYNVGVQYIKRHDYEKAIGIMQAVLKLDPDNSHAQRKVHQLRRILDRAKEGGDEE